MSQHMDALATANITRMERAALRKQVWEGELSPADIIMDTPECAQTLTINGLLGWQRRWGRHRTVRFLRNAGIPENKQLRTFTDRQRRLAAHMLREAPAQDLVL